jgi:hypothetical protein
MNCILRLLQKISLIYLDLSTVCRLYPVLRIRDVYPGADFFPSRILIFPSRICISILTQKMVSKLSEI